jgi:hypothetical protein
MASRVANTVRLFRSMGNHLGKGSFFKSMGLADIDDDTRVSVCGRGRTTIIWRGVVAPALTREDKVTAHKYLPYTACVCPCDLNSGMPVHI